MGSEGNEVFCFPRLKKREKLKSRDVRWYRVLRRSVNKCRKWRHVQKTYHRDPSHRDESRPVPPEETSAAR